jgi:hypothetical protein
MARRKRFKSGLIEQFDISWEYYPNDIALINDTYVVSWRTANDLLDMLAQVREEHDAAIQIYGDEDVLYRHIRNLQKEEVDL